MIPLPTVFPTLYADSNCRAILGSSPMRVYPHGSAPQGVLYPYVTHTAVSITPINSLDRGGAPADSSLVQVSIWSQNGGSGPTSAAAVFAAVRSALEADHDIESIRDMGKDPDTGSYRIDIDVRVFVHRDEPAVSSSDWPSS